MKSGRSACPLKAKNGFTLIEALVALVVLNLVLMGTFYFNDLVLGQIRYNKANQSVLSLKQSIRSHVRSLGRCTSSLSAADGSPLSIGSSSYSKLKSSGGLPVALEIPMGQSNIKIFEGAIIDGLKVNFFRLTNGNKDSVDTWVTFLEMGFEVPAGASPITGGADSLRRFVAPVLLRVKDTDGSLQGCYLAGRQFSSEDFCDAIGEKMENGQCRVRSTMPIDCAAGTVPTAIVNGVVRCDPIGSSENCPVGSALVAVGVGESVCQKF